MCPALWWMGASVAAYGLLLWWVGRRVSSQRRGHWGERTMRGARGEVEARLHEGEDLLLRYVSAEQRREYHEMGYITVRTAAGRRYRITLGNVSNVHELDTLGRRRARWCVTTRVPVPLASLMLAQYLLLTTDEDTFRQIGHHSSP